MRTEVRTVPKLEFIPLPDEALAPCLAPRPPLQEGGGLAYKDLPAYLAEVLGVLEACNLKLELIKSLQPEVNGAVNVFGQPATEPRPYEPVNAPTTPVMPQYDNSATPMVVRVHVFDTLQEVRDSHFSYMMGKTPVLSNSLLAWSAMYFTEEGTPVCEIVVIKPSAYADIAWLYWGHELGHCVYGQWHIADVEE